MAPQFFGVLYLNIVMDICITNMMQIPVTFYLPDLFCRCSNLLKLTYLTWHELGSQFFP